MIVVLMAALGVALVVAGVALAAGAPAALVTAGLSLLAGAWVTNKVLEERA